MKRVLIVLMCVVLALVGLASCAKEEPHTHTYSETWAKDSTNHWYDVTCDCDDIQPTKFAHVDKNNDGACDICEYADPNHTHEYEEGWSANCTNHWKEATCHDIPNGSVAAHADDNSDGICDVCEYVINDLHVHVYDDAWSSDETNHWHAPVCGHVLEGADLAPHNVNAAGYCTVCEAKVNEVDDSDIANILAAASAQYHKVIRGQVTETKGGGLMNVVTEAEYALGNDSTLAILKTTAGSYTSVYYYWSELIAADELFTVGLEYDAWTGAVPEFTQYHKGVEDMGGFNYNPSNILAAKNSSTLENTLSGLYELALTANAHNLVTVNDTENNIVKFSFEYLLVNEIAMGNGGNADAEDVTDVAIKPYLYTVEVEFKYTDDFNIVESDFVVCAYQDGQDTGDTDFTYNHETGEYTLLPSATEDSYTYHTTQQLGVRDYSTPYPKESFIPQTFDYFTDAECTEKVNGELEIVEGEKNILYLGNILPTSAKLEFFNADDITVTVVNKDGGEVFVPYVNTFNGTVNLLSNIVGEFEMTITYKEQVDVINVTVAPAPVQSIDAYVFTWISGNGEQVYTVGAGQKKSEITLAPGDTFDFTIIASPMAADQGWVFTGDSASYVTETQISSPNVFGDIFMDNADTTDVDESIYNAYSFTATEAGVYVITFESTSENTASGETVTGSLTVTVSGGVVIPEVNLTVDAIQNSLGWKQNFTFTAEADATYVASLSAPSANILSDLDNGYLKFRYSTDGGSNYTAIETPYTYEFTLAAGESITLGVQAAKRNNLTCVGESLVINVAAKSATPPPAPSGIVVTVPSSADMLGTLVPFIVPEDGAYTITSDFADIAGFTGADLQISVNDEFIVLDGQLPYTISLLAGTTISFRCNNWGDDAATGATYTVDIELTGEYVEPSVPEMPELESITLGTNIVTVPEEGGWSTPAYVTFTAPAAGVYTFQAAEGETNISAYVAIWDAEYEMFDRDWNIEQSIDGAEGYITLTLAEGEVVIIGVDALDWQPGDVAIDVVEGEYVAPEVEEPAVVDANGLGGEYTFTFVTEWTLTFTPDAEGATSGTLTYVDFNGATHTHTYTIVDGAYVVADNAAFITANANEGKWYFQCGGMASAQPFADYNAPEGGEGEDDTVENVVVGDNSVDVVDTDNGLWVQFTAPADGVYSFTGTDISVYLYGSTSFEGFLGAGASGVELAEGQVVYANVNASTYTAGTYTLVVATVVVPELALGANDLDIADGFSGTNYDFISANGGTYTLSAAAGETNEYVMVVQGSMTEWVTLPYTFTLGAGEKITFNISCYNSQPDQVNLVLAEGDGATEEPAANITGSGTVGDPYVINGEGFVLITPSYAGAIVVVVNVDITLTLDCEAQFYASADSMEGLGTTINAVAGTTYYIYADSTGAAPGQLIAGEVEVEEPSEPEDPVIPEGPVYDANGLGGEYTFKFVVDWTLTFIPDAEGATSGTLIYVDANGASHTHTYTIVDGAYVFDDSTVQVTANVQVGQWYFKCSSMGLAKAFAPYVAPEVEEPSEPSEPEQPEEPSEPSEPGDATVYTTGAQTIVAWSETTVAVNLTAGTYNVEWTNMPGVSIYYDFSGYNKANSFSSSSKTLTVESDCTIYLTLKAGYGYDAATSGTEMTVTFTSVA